MLTYLSGHASAAKTLPSVPAGADRAVEFVALETALRLAVGWDRGRIARRLGLPPHQVRRWRMRGEALLAGREPSPDSREPSLQVVMAMRAMVALAWCAPHALWALPTRAALAEVLDGLESPARFAGDRRPGEYATLEDGADDR